MQHPNARIRPATVLDAEMLAAVHLRAWRETYGPAVPEDVYRQREENGVRQWQERLADSLGPITWIAMRDEQLVGFARAVALGPGQVRPMQLESLYVLQAEQGRRTGTNLLTMSVGDAPCLVWVEQTNTGARDFYGRHGFQDDGARARVDAWGGLQAVRMVR